MFSFTLDIYCTSVRPGRGIPHMWLSLRFLLSFYLLKGFFSSFSLLLLRVKGRGCHTLLKPCETNCGLWMWAIQIKFDWLIEMRVEKKRGRKRGNESGRRRGKEIKSFQWEWWNKRGGYKGRKPMTWREERRKTRTLWNMNVTPQLINCLVPLHW